jgi:DNA-binding CsgD family transcriptional regulator
MSQDEARALIARLTLQELEALRLVAEGQYTKRACEVVGLTYDGFADRRKRVLRKLECGVPRACWLLGRSGL